MPLDPNDEIPLSLSATQINHVIAILQSTLAPTLDLIRTISAQAQAHEQERAAHQGTVANGGTYEPPPSPPAEPTRRSRAAAG
ncbi:MAG: hypothetical protein C5B60_02395 [Chloroflexi bacterium]|nr:MAG: hypothetical protein C5B60_02395 [Chloroflexota bacterium]